MRETQTELSWQRSKNGKATVNYHLHPQVWCMHNGGGDRTPARKAQLVITCRYFWSTVCQGTGPVSFWTDSVHKENVKVWGKYQEIRCSGCQRGRRRVVSAGFNTDHLEVFFPRQSVSRWFCSVWRFHLPPPWRPNKAAKMASQVI